MLNGATDKLSYDISHVVRRQRPKIQNSTNWSYVHLLCQADFHWLHLFSSMHVKFDLI